MTKPKTRKIFVINKSSHDYSQAEKFGELIFMSLDSLKRFSVSKMFRLFQPFIAKSEPLDYILLSGLTVMCCVACGMFAAKHKRLNLLIYKPNILTSGEYVERTVILE